MKKKLKYGIGLSAMMLLGIATIMADDKGRRPPEQDDDDPSTLEFGPASPLAKHGVDNDSGVAHSAPINTAGAHLSYFGGPVLAHIKMIKVLYGGTGSYQSFVTGTGNSSIQGFLTGIVGSAYFTWLTEYNTSSPAQTIGFGTFGGSFTITPASSRNGKTISDTQIMAEISAQISAGHLPAPDANTAYAMFFPKGKTITQGGSKSCQAGGFCAYHGTFKRNGLNIYYDVMPDMSAGSGCDLGCGGGSPFGNQTSVLSHEMIETVTDPAVGLATVVGPPLAWYDPNNGEIGDICNGQQGTVSGTNGASYTVQKEWSNKSNVCKVQ